MRLSLIIRPFRSASDCSHALIKANRCVLVIFMDEFQEWIAGWICFLALVKWRFNSFKLSLSDEQWRSSTGDGLQQEPQKRHQSVKCVKSAPKLCPFTCTQWSKCDYKHVLICLHTVFAFSYRTCLLLASPNHFQSNKITVQRPQRHWTCREWKVESSCWQANYRPLSWSTPWTL